MPLRDFWISVKTAARLISPRAAVDSPRLDTARIEEQLRSAALWLTPRAVEGYEDSDFDFLAKDERAKLTESVNTFRRIAATVPPNATAPQPAIEEALPPFRDILSIIRPDQYADPEALVIGKRVEQIVQGRLPGWVKELVFETGIDTGGDPAIWIWIEVGPEGELLAMQEFTDEFKIVQRALEQAIAKVGGGRWPYIRQRSSAEQRRGSRARTRR